MIAALKERAATGVRERAVRSGRVPRRAYAHYFIEDEGLHSRIHLQNFWSTFWPQFDAPALARIQIRDETGRELGTAEREIPRFGSAFVEMRDLLAELGAQPAEGTVAVDLDPSDEVKRSLGDIPRPLDAEVNTPYWMAYYDASENYMYVHSIDKLGGVVFGTTKPIEWMLNRQRDVGERWRSWRLLELDRLSEVQVVAINHSPNPGRTRVGIYDSADDTPLYEREVELRPRELSRIRVPAGELAGGAREGALGRIGLDPLLTGNGKPYVLLRYGSGPLSIHHG
jgi:hypothetical protein